MLFWRFVISGASTLDPASEGLDNILLAPNPHADEHHLHFYFQFIQRQMEKGKNSVSNGRVCTTFSSM